MFALVQFSVDTACDDTRVEGCLCPLVCCSADQKLLAISLLDNTVKVFFADTCKVRTLALCTFL